jgi:hypothetical protein
VLIFFIAGLLFCASSTSNIGSVSHPAGDRPSHPICLHQELSPKLAILEARFVQG